MTLIDLNALKEWIENWLVMNKYYHPYSKNNSIPIAELYDVLKIMPTVELVNHGHWIDVNCDGSLWKCSVCGETQCCQSNYCGDCGAKMDVPDISVGKMEEVKE